MTMSISDILTLILVIISIISLVESVRRNNH